MDSYKKDKNSTPYHDDIIYEYVLEEMDHGKPNKGILTKAVLQSDGDDEKAKSLYLKYRVESIEQDIQLLEIDIGKYSKEQLFNFIQNDFKNYKKTSKKKIFLYFIVVFFILVSTLFIFKSSNFTESITQELLPIISKKSTIKDTQGNSYQVVISPYTNRVWLDRNLGAQGVCESFSDDQCFGSYFQWGRGADGHQKHKSKINSELSKEADPGHNEFIIGDTENRYDWILTQDNTLWKGLYAQNNPCPKGFRIPSSGEFKKELIDHGGTNIHKGFHSFLKLPYAGYRNFSGAIDHQGFEGRYWTSSIKAQFALAFSMASNSAKPYLFFFERANGYSLRCIKEEKF